MHGVGVSVRLYVCVRAREWVSACAPMRTWVGVCLLLGEIEILTFSGKYSFIVPRPKLPHL